MSLVNFTTREITCKIVYYGPGRSGKTTNLQYIYGRVPEDRRGRMVSLATQTDRTLFFDFLPLDVGAAGYVLKNADAAELEMAVRAVARGDGYLSPAVARHVVRGAVRRGESDTTQLTPRQREILQLIAEGASTKQIAAKLGLSVKTVETHRAKLMERLDIHDVAGLVRYAIRAGFIAPEA